MKKKFCESYIKYIFEYIRKQLNEEINIDMNDYKEVKELMQKVLFAKCFKSLLYCMNVERIDNNLLGENPEKRYISFSETNYCIEAMDKMFPTIKEQLYKEVIEKCKYILEVVNIYEKNKIQICEHFFHNSNEIIEEITNSGDWHNDKCVLIFKFTSGNKIVYKPTRGKNIEFLKGVLSYFFDENYLEMYDYLYEKDGTWVKFIHHQEVFEEKKINRFYYNYGKIIYISYLLGINDMHYENLIANEEYPIITDVETIFSSYLFFDTHQFEYNAQFKAVQRLLYGVMATGLVPIFSMTEYFGGDVSCLSNKGIKVKVEKVKNEYRDDMRIYSETEVITNYEHLPNKNIDPLMFRKAILEGFEEANQIFNNNRNRIIACIQEKLHKVEARIILNMTKGYSKIVLVKSDPRYRNNSELFAELIKKLKRSNQFNDKVYEYEVEELGKGNIPSFYWNLSLNYVYGYKVKEIKQILEIHSFTKDKVKEILDYQTEKSMVEKQRKLIDNSIISNIVLGIEYKGMEIKEEERQAIHSKKEELLIENISNNKILGDDKTISWIGLLVNDKEQLEYAVLDWSLYSGIIGIGYMYIAEYSKKKDTLSKDIIERIFYTLNKAYDCETFRDYNISYYCGLTGIYSFLIKLKEDSIIDVPVADINKIKQLIINNIEKTNVYDTLSGIHSAVIYFYARYAKDGFSKVMLEILEKYCEDNFDLNIMNENFNYASFAHGYSGVMTSFLCMNKICKSDNFEILLKELWKKENSLYKGRFQWDDLRNTNETHSHFWCHGSCGIMFSRLIWKQYELLQNNSLGLTDDDLSENLNLYKDYIEKDMFQSQNYSLCHGNFAFIDFMIAYSKVFHEDTVKNEYITNTLNSAKEHGYSCVGAPGAINSIGFMVGESGIQYMINRFENNEIPSILVMETI